MGVERTIGNVRKLIWAYYLLWIFEGVLRKWIFPSLASPLVFVRDGVLILLYIQALRAHVFPRNGFMLAAGFLAMIATIAGCIVIPNSMGVILYGIRTDFMHLPLIFIIPRVFDISDVKHVGFWTLLIAVPMAMLIVMQFRAGPGDFINAGAGEGQQQIGAGLGHIRAAGTFSYVLGPAYFFPCVTAFLLYGQLSRHVYPRPLVIAGAISVIAACAFSISRTLLFNVIITAGFALITALAVDIKLAMRWVTAAIGVAILAILMGTRVPAFIEAVDTFSIRFENASKSEESGGGVAGRILASSRVPEAVMADPMTMFLGKGLGMGTNGAAVLLTGERQFLLAESEWERIFMESGLVIGGAFVLYRITLAAWLTILAFRAARAGNSLPLLITSTCLPLITHGQWGLPTTLGFAVFGAGISLAAMRPARALVDDLVIDDSTGMVEPPAPSPVGA
jgi:hypothetical protein